MSEDSTTENAGTNLKEPELSSTAPAKKKPLISLPFAIFAVVVLGVGFLYGQKIMEWVMLQQEAAKAATGPQEPEEYAGLSQLAKNLQSGNVDDPAAAFSAAGTVPPEGGAGGGRPPAEEPAEVGDASGGAESETSDKAAEANAEVASKEDTASAAPAGRGGRLSPEERFAQQDKDGDGKLSGEEIPAPMKERMEMLDTDSDGSISKEELVSAMEKMRSSRGSGGGGGISAGENQ